MPAPGMPPPGGSSLEAPVSGGTLNGDVQGEEIAYAPTSAMPAAMPSGFAQPVAQPPGAPPPGFPRPPQASPEISDDDDAVATTPVVPPASAAALPVAGAGVAAAGQAEGSSALSSEDFITLYKQAWEFLKPVLIPAVLTTGAVTVPVAVAGWILGLIPVVGPILGLLLTLAEALVMPFAIAALTRFLLGHYLNHPVDWITSWKQQIANPKMVWVSFVVAGLIAGVGALFLIIPGILLGSFIGIIYFCEGKRMVDINMRNLEIAKQDPMLLIISLIVVIIGVALALGVPIWVLGLIPFVGGLLVSVLVAASIAVITPFLLVLSILLYFQIRRRFEGGEPEVGAMQMLIATAAALPEETDDTW